MAVALKIPQVGESVTEVFVSKWLKKEGQSVRKDEAVAELETDKASVELPSPVSGTLKKILVQEGDQAEVGQSIGEIEEGDGGGGSSQEGKKSEESKKEKEGGDESKEDTGKGEAAKSGGGKASSRKKTVSAKEGEAKKSDPRGDDGGHQEEKTGADEKKREDEEAGERELKAAAEPEEEPSAEREDSREEAARDARREREDRSGDEREEESVTMSPMRQTIARRLVEAQRTAALLTTFNEVDMSSVMEMRKRYRDSFAEMHGVKLGFMSFFVRAAVDALQTFPAINARVDDRRIVYRNYYDIGVAVSTDRGLVVPVIRDAQKLGFAEIERAIADYAQRAREGALSINDLEGGTFTLTNGGVFGSLLSTPIVNPPQSGVLGMHAIQDRPVALNGQVVIRPMMYVALTYDHRIVDGREAVSFLVHLKQLIEDPARMLLDV